jgi:thioredoxin
VQNDHSLIKIFSVICVLAGMFLYNKMSLQEIELPRDSEFIRQVTNAKPVIVKFGADWCPPCRYVEAELDKLTTIYGDRVHVVKVDVDARPDLAQHYRVSGIPHIMLFEYGKQSREFKGAKTAEDIARWAGLNTKP